VLDVAALEQLVDRDVAALMVTNPNTLGVFEENIAQAAEILHAKGAMLYMDGANMNALVGIARPGDFGVDVLHLNLHKTFSTPHGGGGPGRRSGGREEGLEPFLPVPRLKRAGKKWAWITTARTPSAACAPSTATSACWCARWPTSWRTAARACATPPSTPCSTPSTSARARAVLRSAVPRPVHARVVFSDARQAAKGVRTGDIAKRLIDYGFHPYTVSFPLIVHGALMIEPTETEGKLELDQFIAAMISIAKEVETDPATGARMRPTGRAPAAWMKSPPRASRCCDGSRRRPARQLLLVLGLVLLIRIPFPQPGHPGRRSHLSHRGLPRAHRSAAPRRHQIRVSGRGGGPARPAASAAGCVGAGRFDRGVRRA
jgi:glycine cleavage system protein P-like pyridoxal-binding family